LGVGEDTSDPRRTWVFLLAVGAIGLALGVLVGIATDVPLALETGVIIGVAVGWLLSRVRT
jgi:hypothetical protein